MAMVLISANLFWIHFFLVSYGISTTPSPSTIVTGQTIDLQKQCQLKFKEYFQINKYTDNTIVTGYNTTAIELYTTSTDQAPWKFTRLS